MRSVFALILSWLKKIVAAITGKPAVEEPDDGPAQFELSEPVPGPGEVICYYGCPNSNKAKKLQLNKKIYR